MIDRDTAVELLTAEVHLFTEAGDDLGPVRRIFLDDYTSWPSFCTVDATGGRGEESYVALHRAEVSHENDAVVVPYERERVARAPRSGRDVGLSREDEDHLFDYYEVPIEGVVPAVEHLGDVLELDGADVVSSELTEPDDPQEPRAH